MNEIPLKRVLKTPRSLRENAFTKAQYATKIPTGLCQEHRRNGGDHFVRSRSLPTLTVRTTRPAGLEPATFGFEVRDSIQLSYGRIVQEP